VVGLTFQKLKSSMPLSFERGRRTEINSMNGGEADKGRAVGLSAPVNEALITMVREIEAETRTISSDNLQSLLE
jgi:ketopantoate reductase